MAARDRGLGVFVGVTLLAPLVAGGALVLAATDRSPLASSRAPAPVLANVSGSQRSDETSVTVRLAPATTVTPRGQAFGMVTAVTVAPGSHVATGAAVMTVGDGAVLAYQAARPLFSDVSASAAKSQVAEAQQVLADLDLYHGQVDGRWGPTTRTAVRAFNAAHGYGSSDVLRLASLVWIGAVPVTLATVEVAAGDTTQPGDALFTTTADVAGVVVNGAPTDAALVLDVNGVETTLEPGQTLVTDTAVVAAVLHAGADAQVAGTVWRATPVTVGSVPASSVVVDAGGISCLFENVDGPPVPVVPTGGSLGTVDVDPALIGRPLLVNPRDVRTDLDCG